MLPNPTNRCLRSAALRGLAGLLLPVLLAALPSGCSKRHYEKSADREVYRLIEQAEQKVFGRTNAFTIATPYSDRDPKSILPAEILEDRTRTNRRVLNLETALNLAVQQSREYQSQKEQLYLSALSLTGARYEFSPQFFANSTASLSGTGDSSSIGSVDSRVGVDQLLRTGGRLGVSLANDLTRYFVGWSQSGFGSSRDSAINTLSVNLSQPLLRGFGINSPEVEALTQAERNVVYSVRSFSQYQRQFAVDIVNAYFGLLRQKDTVRNNYTNYLRRLELARYNEARSVDRASALVVDQAHADELDARISYVTSIATYLNAAAAFKLRLGLPQSEEIYFDDKDLRELADTGLIPVEIGRESAFHLAVERHLEILNAIDRFEDSKRKLRIAADQLKPGLLLSSSATIASDAPYDYTSFDLEKVRYNVGLALDLPVDRLRQRNTYRAAIVSFESQVRTLANTLDSSKRDIEDGFRNLEQARLNLLSRREALALAVRREESSRISFEAGRLQILDLRNAQDALISAQNNLIFTLVSYLQIRLGILLDIGVIRTEEPRFWLKDPLAEILTPDTRGRAPLEMPREELIPPHQFIEPRP